MIVTFLTITCEMDGSLHKVNRNVRVEGGGGRERSD